MTFIPTVGGAKAVVICEHGTEVWTNTFWFDMFGWESGDLAALAAIVDTCFAGVVKPAMSIDCNYLGVRVYGMQTVADPTYYIVTGAGAGAESGDALPLSNACVLTLRTGARGRSGRGRTYFTGFGEDHFDGNVFDSSVTDACENFGVALDAAATVAGWNWDVVSFQENGVVRSTGLARKITSFEVRYAKPGSQRRRLDRL